MDSYRFGAFVFDPDAGVLRHASQVLPLQPKVVDVLHYLIERRGEVVSKGELLGLFPPQVKARAIESRITISVVAER